MTKICNPSLTCVDHFVLSTFVAKIPFWGHTKQKSRRGVGFRQINTCRQVPLHYLLWVWSFYALHALFGHKSAAILIKGQPGNLNRIFFNYSLRRFLNFRPGLMFWYICILQVSIYKSMLGNSIFKILCSENTGGGVECGISREVSLYSYSGREFSSHSREIQPFRGLKLCIESLNFLFKDAFSNG